MVITALNILILFILALFPALIWLFFFLKEDIHPEPRKMILYVFILGALISFPVLIFQIAFLNMYGASFKIYNSLDIILVLAFIEEFLKFLVVYIFIRKNVVVDEPIDLMIYLVTAALGFAAVENFFVVVNFAVVADFSYQLIEAVRTLLFRFMGATLLHSFASAIFGYYWALGWLKSRKNLFVTLGLTAAVAIHSVFNYLVLNFQEQSVFYPILFLIVAGFFVFSDFEKLRSS